MKKFKTLKKTLMLMLCTVLVIGCFAACGGGGENDADKETQTEDQYASFPEKSITLIVPYAAGGESDNIARPIAQYMKNAGYTVVVQNIEGASGNIGVMEAYNANPDGYTFMLHMPESMEIYAQSGDLPGGPLDMMKMIANVVMDSGVLSVAPDSEFQTLDDLIAYGKAHPGELKAASTGTMGYNQVSIEMLYKTLGIDVNYVPYENAAKAKAAVMGGHADILHCYLSGAVAPTKNKEIRPLVIGATERSSYLPDVPTLSELGYDLTWGFHRSFMTTAETPDEIVAKMEEAIKAAFDDPAVQEAYKGMGFNSYWLSAADLTKEIKEQMPAVDKAYQDLKAEQ